MMDSLRVRPQCLGVVATASMASLLVYINYQFSSPVHFTSDLCSCAGFSYDTDCEPTCIGARDSYSPRMMFLEVSADLEANKSRASFNISAPTAKVELHNTTVSTASVSSWEVTKHEYLASKEKTTQTNATTVTIQTTASTTTLTATTTKATTKSSTTTTLSSTLAEKHNYITNIGLCNGCLSGKILIGVQKG